MKRRTALLLPLAALPVSAALTPGRAAAAAPAAPAALEPRALLPTIRNGAQPASTLIKLVDRDCGLVNALHIGGGRVWVGYQSRPDGHAHIQEDVGERLVDIPSDQLALLAPFLLAVQPPAAPAFDLPGPKQGSLSQIVVPTAGGQLEVRIYFTGRAEDDPTGPFFVWRLIVSPIPPTPTGV